MLLITKFDAKMNPESRYTTTMDYEQYILLLRGTGAALHWERREGNVELIRVDLGMLPKQRKGRVTMPRFDRTKPAWYTTYREITREEQNGNDTDKSA